MDNENSVTRKLIVKNNTSYTTDENITGSCKDMIIYDNTIGEHTEIADNKTPTMTTVSSFEDLTSALASAKEGAYIKLAPGEYGTFNYKNGLSAENVTIDCGGAVFTGENHVRFDPTTTIKNATFRNYDTASRSGQGPASGVYNDICGNYENCIFEGVSALEYGSIQTDVNFKNCQFLAKGDHAIHIDQFTVDNTVATFVDCTISGYCPLGGSHGSYVFEGCTFSTNDAGFGGVGLRRPSTLTNCKFYISGEYDHDEIALKNAGVSYVFDGCTVNDQALSADYAFAVGEENIKVTIDGVETPLVKTGDKDKRQ